MSHSGGSWEDFKKCFFRVKINKFLIIMFSWNWNFFGGIYLCMFSRCEGGKHFQKITRRIFTSGQSSVQKNCAILVWKFSTGSTHVNFRNNYFYDSLRNND